MQSSKTRCPYSVILWEIKVFTKTNMSVELLGPLRVGSHDLF